METILEAIGHTPLVPIRRAVPSTSARIFAKLERFNPGGSLKDRLVLRILTKAEEEGRLRTGMTLIAATTGNSGIALAWIGNIKRYRVVLAMPENYSLERRRILEGYGAQVYLTPASDGMEGALRRARGLAEKEGGLFVNQFADPETVEAHLETYQEIESALARPIHAFVATYGTGGSLMGVGRLLKQKGTKIVAVEPALSPLLSEGRAGPHRIEGTTPGFVSPLLDRKLIDEVIVVSDQQAFDSSRELARQEGILVGLSSGAAFCAAEKTARRLGPEKNIVTLFPDGGERYLSLWKDFEGPHVLR